MTDKKIILFELNEVPFSVIDRFCERFPKSTFAQYLPRMHQFTTVSEDVGHLSPWITWPTLHRGVDNRQHQIKDLGEDFARVDQDFPPLWKLTADAGVKTGVFASLHSYPLPKDAAADYHFYVPDPFARTPECHPDYVNSFQNLNLALSRKSDRVVAKGLELNAALKVVRDLPRLGLRAKTLVDVSRQLLQERFDAKKRVRRRTYQGVLSFDIFLRLLKKTKPSFVTFFTNHVASSQHRYWAASFPQDYQKYECDEEWREDYQGEIWFAMRKADGFLRELIDFADRHPEYEIWVTSSMGQAATQARTVTNELGLRDLPRFMQFLGFRASDWKALPAMRPQVNLELGAAKTEVFEAALKQIRLKGSPLVYRRRERFFSLDFGCEDAGTDAITYRGQSVAPQTLGAVIETIDDRATSTAYHIPEGIWLVYGGGIASLDRGRRKFPTTRLAPTVLRALGLPRPSYMGDPVAFTAGKE